MAQQVRPTCGVECSRKLCDGQQTLTVRSPQLRPNSKMKRPTSSSSVLSSLSLDAAVAQRKKATASSCRLLSSPAFAASSRSHKLAVSSPLDHVKAKSGRASSPSPPTEAKKSRQEFHQTSQLSREAKEAAAYPSLAHRQRVICNDRGYDRGFLKSAKMSLTEKATPDNDTDRHPTTTITPPVVINQIDNCKADDCFRSEAFKDNDDSLKSHKRERYVKTYKNTSALDSDYKHYKQPHNKLLASLSVSSTMSDGCTIPNPLSSNANLWSQRFFDEFHNDCLDSTDDLINQDNTASSIDDTSTAPVSLRQHNDRNHTFVNPDISNDNACHSHKSANDAFIDQVSDIAYKDDKDDIVSKDANSSDENSASNDWGKNDCASTENDTVTQAASMNLAHSTMDTAVAVMNAAVPSSPKHSVTESLSNNGDDPYNEDAFTSAMIVAASAMNIVATTLDTASSLQKVIEEDAASTNLNEDDFNEDLEQKVNTLSQCAKIAKLNGDALSVDIDDSNSEDEMEAIPKAETFGVKGREEKSTSALSNAQDDEGMADPNAFDVKGREHILTPLSTDRIDGRIAMIKSDDTLTHTQSSLAKGSVSLEETGPKTHTTLKSAFHHGTVIDTSDNVSVKLAAFAASETLNQAANLQKSTWEQAAKARTEPAAAQKAASDANAACLNQFLKIQNAATTQHEDLSTFQETNTEPSQIAATKVNKDFNLVQEADTKTVRVEASKGEQDLNLLQENNTKPMQIAATNGEDNFYSFQEIDIKTRQTAATTKENEAMEHMRTSSQRMKHDVIFVTNEAMNTPLFDNTNITAQTTVEYVTQVTEVVEKAAAASAALVLTITGTVASAEDQSSNFTEPLGVTTKSMMISPQVEETNSMQDVENIWKNNSISLLQTESDDVLFQPPKNSPTECSAAAQKQVRQSCGCVTS